MLVPAARLKEADIGGGVVHRAFRMGDRYLMTGSKLSAKEIMSINAPNRMALIDKGYLAVWPPSGDAPARLDLQRYAIHNGNGNFDVVEGRKINDAPLTREEAKALAAKVHKPH